MEDSVIYKCYLRSLMRHLMSMKEALRSGNVEKAEKLLDELLDDTRKNIED